jgi:hypothetical protein
MRHPPLSSQRATLLGPCAPTGCLEAGVLRAVGGCRGEGARGPGLLEAGPAARPAAGRCGLRTYLPVPPGRRRCHPGACDQQAVAGVAHSRLSGYVGCGFIVCRIHCALCLLCVESEGGGKGCEGLESLHGCPCGTLEEGAVCVSQGPGREHVGHLLVRPLQGEGKQLESATMSARRACPTISLPPQMPAPGQAARAHSAASRYQTSPTAMGGTPPEGFAKGRRWASMRWGGGLGPQPA